MRLFGLKYPAPISVPSSAASSTCVPGGSAFTRASSASSLANAQGAPDLTRRPSRVLRRIAGRLRNAALLFLCSQPAADPLRQHPLLAAGWRQSGMEQPLVG